MNKFKLFLFDIGTAALILFATFMPDRVRDFILDWMFHPVKDSPLQISRMSVEDKNRKQIKSL
jgi:hypothetical protein